MTALENILIGRAHFVGRSLGAKVAVNIAARHPDRVDRLVLLCTTAHFESDAPWIERAATVRADGVHAVAHFLVARWLTSTYAHANPSDVEKFRAKLTAIDADCYARCGEAIGARHQRSILSDVQAPTLVVAGTDAQPPSRPGPAGWTRDDKLDRRTRSCITIALLTGLRLENELAMHIRASIRNGLTPEEITEVIMHTAPTPASHQPTPQSLSPSTC